MSISSGKLDSLLNASFDPQALAALTYKSGSATGSAVTSVTAVTGFAPYAGANSLTVTTLDDSSNIIVVTASVSGVNYGYGNPGSTSVPYYFTVIGTVGADLLLAADSAAANNAVSAASIASSIESGNSSTLSSELFTLSTNGTLLGASVTVPQTLTFSGLTPATVTVATALSESQAGQLSSPAVISDTAANVQSGLDALQALAAAHNLASIALTDSATPTMTITTAQNSADAGALLDITSSFALAITGVTAAAASSTAGLAHVASVAVTDSAADVVTSLDSLQSLAAAGKLSGITLTDSGFATLSITPAQLTGDSMALADISGNFVVTVSAAAANLTLTGVSGHGTTAIFTGSAAQYGITPTGDGVSFTVTDSSTGRTSVDHLSNFNALSFNDFTDIVAQTPGTSTVTSGNVTELYGAVFGRLPDVAGLAYYQNLLQTSPTIPLTVFAQFFLQSPEYANNSAHTYAQTTAGDTQFINDSYTNLLHRTAESSGLAFYLNLISQFTTGLTPGTAAFTSAEALAHAYVITDFSASAEFLGNVQITAQHPADAQHWLILI